MALLISIDRQGVLLAIDVQADFTPGGPLAGAEAAGREMAPSGRLLR
jgi:nicotinamidase-related amidase